jgi:hypothetical protein
MIANSPPTASTQPTEPVITDWQYTQLPIFSDLTTVLALTVLVNSMTRLAKVIKEK